MISKSVASLGLVGLVLLAGCGAQAPATLTIANRTDAALTVGPGIVIPACGLTTTTFDAYDAARLKAGEMAMNNQTWDAPPGALVWTNLAFAFSDSASKTATTVVVTSTADPAVKTGTVAENALPPCGGQPVGVEPGLPQGEEPVFTMEPASP